MKQLRLTCGDYAIVDEDLVEDLERLTDLRVHPNGSGRGYVKSCRSLRGEKWGRRRVTIPGPGGHGVYLSKLVWLLRTREYPVRVRFKNLDPGDCRFCNLTLAPVYGARGRYFPGVTTHNNRWCTATRCFPIAEYEEACRDAYLDMCQRAGDSVYTPPPMPTVLYPEKVRATGQAGDQNGAFLSPGVVVGLTTGPSRPLVAKYPPKPAHNRPEPVPWWSRGC